MMNNRTLLYIFLVILAIFFGAKFLKKDHKSSFDPVLSAVDSTQVDRIRFVTGGEEKDEFELVKTSGNWEAIKGNMKVPVPASSVSPLLSQLSSLNAEKILTKDNTRYAEYEITDDEASEVIVYNGKKELAHLLLGGFRFDQATRSAAAFVRKKNDPAVYEVNGFTVMGLRQSFDQYRDKTLVKADVNDLSKLDWTNSAGRKEAIVKEDGEWHYAGMEKIDSSRIQPYLQMLVNVKGVEFSELTSTEGLQNVERLTITGNNMIESIVISAYGHSDTTKPFLIHSSVNPDALFLSDSVGIYKRIFGDLRQFWPDGQ